ncbi:MAG: radical SAM protein [Spirochaetia bacterium]|nr:radical SAM protein [Spirochaetia bacterium]
MFTVSDERVSLYIHIPFCTTCCSYCAFYSEPKTQWNGNLDSYVQRLLQEVILVEQNVEGFDTIFIGGGNPGCLSLEQLTSLLSAAQKKKKSREVTIEMNPESFNESFFPLFEQNLVTRLSIGIQSMQDGVLTQLQRNARRIDNLKAIELAQKARALYGIDISFDLPH